MRSLLLLIITSVLLLRGTWAKELSREEALKLGSDNDVAAYGDFWYEHGDASPPFQHVSRMIFSKGSGGYLSITGDPSAGFMVDSPHGEGTETRLDFFLSSRGLGRVTAHVLKPQVVVKPPEPPRDGRREEQRSLGLAAEMAARQLG